MLLSETQAACNDLLELIEESIDLYQDHAAQLPASDRKEQLDRLMEERQQLLEELRQQARQSLGLRPRAADLEMEGLTHLLGQFRSLWQSPEGVALEVMRDQEKAVHDALKKLQQQNEGLPEHLQLSLRKLADHLAAIAPWWRP